MNQNGSYLCAKNIYIFVECSLLRFQNCLDLVQNKYFQCEFVKTNFRNIRRAQDSRPHGYICYCQGDCCFLHSRFFYMFSRNSSIYSFSTPVIHRI